MFYKDTNVERESTLITIVVKDLCYLMVSN